MMNYNSANNLENYEVIGYIENEQQDIKISLNNPDLAYVKITVLSDIPDSVRDTPYNDQIRVYINDIPGIEDDPTDSNFARRSKILSFMQEHLLVVQPYVKRDFRDGKVYHIGENVSILNKKDNFNKNERLCPIPAFSAQDTGIDNVNEFVQYLKQRTTLSTIRNPWSYDEDDVPFGTLWQDDDKSYLFFDIDKQHHSDNGISFKMNSFHFILVNNDWLSRQYKNQDLIYIKKEFIGNHKGESKDFDPGTIESDTKDMVTATSDIDNDTNDNIDDTQRADPILDNFLATIHSPKYNLTLNQSDIINFHNSIKSNVLTLLTGLSGTGKSKITTAYADALGIKNDEQFNMVSVRPFWQDDADVLGFVNTLNNTYNPGDSGVVDTLVHAQQHPDQMHLIVFDEMNLARIEYYFSQFLSVLEKAPEDRYIQLYNASLEPRLYNGQIYPHSLRVPENVRFIGTMNVDETTFQVSDKVLDRANVITLQQPSFLEARNQVAAPSDKERVDRIHETTYPQYQASIHNDRTRLSDRELTFMDALNGRIQESLPNVGISWRTVQNISKFLSNVSYYNYHDFSRRDALDYQIAQRVLPKLRGTEAMLYDILGWNDDRHNDTSIEGLLDQYSDLSDFHRTQAALHQKSKEIQVMGFAN